MNYKKLLEDARTGKLHPQAQLAMDNDGGYWDLDGDFSDEDFQRITAELEVEYGLPDGYKDIVDVLQAAGIDCDWC